MIKKKKKQRKKARSNPEKILEENKSYSRLELKEDF